MASYSKRCPRSSLRKKTLCSLHTLGAAYPVMRHRIQEEQNSQLHQCENVKTYNLEEAGILNLNIFYSLRSQMISQEDYNFIVAFDNADAANREALLKDNRSQCARTFLNLLGHVSKDQTIQYILIMIDDMLQVC